MAALTTDLLIREFYQGMVSKPSRRPSLGKVAASAILFLGAVCMQVDGIAQPVVSGTAMTAKCLTVPGANAGANAGVILSSREDKVRIVFANGGNSQVLSVGIAYGDTIDITVNLATDNAGAVTSTANAVVAAIRAHAEANRILRAKATGNGTGLAAVITATAVPHITLLGVNNQRRYTNDVAQTDVLPQYIAFTVGPWGMQGNNKPPVANQTPAYLVDDQTVTLTADPLSLRAPVVANDQGLIFVDLKEAV